MKTKVLSKCCGAPAKQDRTAESFRMFCTKCVKTCQTTTEKTGFASKRSTLSTVRKVTGEGSLFNERYEACKGLSEVSGTKLLPPGHAQFHFQGCHLLPKGAYPKERLNPANVVMTTVEEHLEEWPFVKEKTDQELKSMGMAHWIPVVTRFRALRLKANTQILHEHR